MPTTLHIGPRTRMPTMFHPGVRTLSLMLPVVLLLVLLGCILLAEAGVVQVRDDRGFDPTGTWYGQHGPLVLMRAGDTARPSGALRAGGPRAAGVRMPGTP